MATPRPPHAMRVKLFWTSSAPTRRICVVGSERLVDHISRVCLDDQDASIAPPAEPRAKSAWWSGLGDGHQASTEDLWMDLRAVAGGPDGPIGTGAGCCCRGCWGAIPGRCMDCGCCCRRPYGFVVGIGFVVGPPGLPPKPTRPRDAGAGAPPQPREAGLRGAAVVVGGAAPVCQRPRPRDAGAGAPPAVGIGARPLPMLPIPRGGGARAVFPMPTLREGGAPYRPGCGGPRTIPLARGCCGAPYAP